MLVMIIYKRSRTICPCPPNHNHHLKRRRRSATGQKWNALRVQWVPSLGVRETPIMHYWAGFLNWTNALDLPSTAIWDAGVTAVVVQVHCNCRYMTSGGGGSAINMSIGLLVFMTKSIRCFIIIFVLFNQKPRFFFYYSSLQHHKSILHTPPSLYQCI